MNENNRQRTLNTAGEQGVTSGEGELSPAWIKFLELLYEMKAESERRDAEKVALAEAKPR